MPGAPPMAIVFDEADATKVAVFFWEDVGCSEFVDSRGDCLLVCVEQDYHSRLCAVFFGALEAMSHICDTETEAEGNQSYLQSNGKKLR